MNRKISRRQLRQIRDSLELHYPSKGSDKNILFASIVLPEPCDNETLLYANKLCVKLQKVNCNVEISSILQFLYPELIDKDFEVMDQVPLGSPCIRVYPKQPKQKTSIIDVIKRWIS